ncbi:MAG: acyl carrier protein [Solirubrobacteraceae bacterium]
MSDVEEFIVREIALGRGIDSVAHDRDLLDGGVIDSLGIVQLISFLEENYGIKVDDDDLDPENFRSLDSIAVLVEKKKMKGA